MRDAPVRKPGDFERTTKGVPLVADADGALTKPKNKRDPGHVKKVMYRRPSSFGKQIENTYNLQKWGERQEALGFALDFNLLKRAQALLDGDRESKAWKDEADEVVVAAKAAAKAWIAAERGTHTHGLTEDDDTDVDIVTRLEHGEDLGLNREVQQALVAAWREMLERNGLEIVAVEFACVNDHYRAAGTGDRVARLTRPLRFRLITGELVELTDGTYVILDLKTGQRRLDSNGVVMYWQSYAVQVALYAGGCLYDPDTDTRTPFPWPVDQDWAVIAHLDVLGALEGNPSCELVLVDLNAGRRAADLCVGARDWENDSTVFSVAQLEVEGEYDRLSPGEHAGSPSTPLSGEGERAANPTPSPADEPKAGPQPPEARPLPGVVSGTTGATPDCGITRLVPDPARLALVDTRATLATNPDQGAGIDEFNPVWPRLKALFDTLPPSAIAWRSRLVVDAQRRNVPFHAQEVKTERGYWLNKAVIALALNEPSDPILRELMAQIVGDVALFPAVTPGHVLGSMGVDEARRLAALVDQYNQPPPAA